MNHLKEMMDFVYHLPLKPQDLKDKSFERIFEIYENSFRIKDNVMFYGLRFKWKDYLVLASNQEIPWDFKGEASTGEKKNVLICEETPHNCRLLRSLFPDLEPVPVGKNRSTFGVGDRLGVATGGHLMAFSYYPSYVPILAQQSMRELQLTDRTYRDIVDAALWAVFKAGYKGPWGADGDHLKDAESVKMALEQGCTMITADLSDHMHPEHETVSDDEVLILYQKTSEQYRQRIERDYLPIKTYESAVSLNYSKKTLAKLVLTYKEAIEFAKELYIAGLSVREDFDFEISIDETTIATSIEAHYFIARELQLLEIPFTSMAPRYVGEFQKGIDYIGDIEEFADNFSLHAELAARMNYKISVHSSSDKFSAYPVIKDKLAGPCHLKTSGTNWLVALQVIACSDPDLFRKLFIEAYKVYETARAYYHITPDWSLRSDISQVLDEELTNVFNNNTDRQVLHVSYGELKKNKMLWDSFESVLNQNLSMYWLLLENHIGRHLNLLS